MRARISVVYAVVLRFFNAQAEARTEPQRASVRTEFHVPAKPQVAAFETEVQKFVFTGSLDFLVAALSRDVPPRLKGVEELFMAGDIINYFVGEAKSIEKIGGFEGIPQTLAEFMTLRAHWMEVERQRADATGQPPRKLPR